MKTILLGCISWFLKAHDHLANAFSLTSPPVCGRRAAIMLPSLFDFKPCRDSSLYTSSSVESHDSKSGYLSKNDRKIFSNLILSLTATEQLLDVVNKRKIRVAAKLSLMNSYYGVEVDLRPVLQKSVTDWYIRRYRPQGKLVTAVAFKAFARLVKSSDAEDRYDKIRLHKAIENSVKDGKVDGAVRENVEQILEKMWLALSDAVLPTKDEILAIRQINNFGYVVGGSGDFSAAASAMLRFFNVEHVVMSPGYKEKRYLCSEAGVAVGDDCDEEEEFSEF